jgi:signal peptidase II
LKRWLWLSLAVLTLDQASKWLMLRALNPFEAIALVPNVNLTLMFNEGAAFSFLATAGGWQRWLFAALALTVSGALIVWLSRLKSNEALQAAGLALLIGGALGNLIDRILLGHVVDFIQVFLPFIPLEIFNPWPAFNIADSAITVGVVILLIATLIADEGRSPPSTGKTG